LLTENALNQGKTMARSIKSVIFVIQDIKENIQNNKLLATERKE
jgi:hypothetical protein